MALDFEDGYFATLFLGRFDPTVRFFVYAAAGHQSHLLDTDGIPEAAYGASDFYGMRRALDLAESHRHRPAGAITEILCRNARAFSRDTPQPDDMTAVVLKVL